MRPGRGVREQQLDVAGAHITAIDAVGGALAAADAARHFEDGALVMGKRRVARAAVERQDDLGQIARRAAGGPGKDHIVHFAATQPLGGALAHHPAQCLDEIGFAAAIRADDAGQPGLDRQLGRLDERFEAGKTKPLYLHKLNIMIFRPLRTVLCRRPPRSERHRISCH